MLKGARAPPFLAFFSFFILLFYLKFFDYVLHFSLCVFGLNSTVFGLNSTVLGLNSTVFGLNSTVLVFLRVIFRFELHGFYKVPLLIINHLRFLSCKKGFELHGKNTVKKRYFFSDFLSLWISRWISRWISVLTY